MMGTTDVVPLVAHIISSEQMILTYLKDCIFFKDQPRC